MDLSIRLTHVCHSGSTFRALVQITISMADSICGTLHPRGAEDNLVDLANGWRLVVLLWHCSFSHSAVKKKG